jgi:hypothetical protein
VYYNANTNARVSDSGSFCKARHMSKNVVDWFSAVQGKVSKRKNVLHDGRVGPPREGPRLPDFLESFP